MTAKSLYAQRANSRGVEQEVKKIETEQKNTCLDTDEPINFHRIWNTARVSWRMLVDTSKPLLMLVLTALAFTFGIGIIISCGVILGFLGVIIGICATQSWLIYGWLKEQISYAKAMNAPLVIALSPEEFEANLKYIIQEAEKERMKTKHI